MLHNPLFLCVTLSLVDGGQRRLEFSDADDCNKLVRLVHLAMRTEVRLAIVCHGRSYNRLWQVTDCVFVPPDGTLLRGQSSGRTYGRWMLCVAVTNSFASYVMQEGRKCEVAPNMFLLRGYGDQRVALIADAHLSSCKSRSCGLYKVMTLMLIVPSGDTVSKATAADLPPDGTIVRSSDETDARRYVMRNGRLIALRDGPAVAAALRASKGQTAVIHPVALSAIPRSDETI